MAIDLSIPEQRPASRSELVARLQLAARDGSCVLRPQLVDDLNAAAEALHSALSEQQASSPPECKHRFWPEKGDGVIQCIFCKTFGERRTEYPPSERKG